MENNRIDKINYYLDIAQVVAERGTCLRRKFGAVIVKNDVIISTGYAGAPRGRKNCCDLGTCLREELKIPHGERYELCRSVHAEANAIIAASREEMLGSALYLACIDTNENGIISGTMCCSMCQRLIINAGISTVYIRNSKKDYTIVDVEKEWIERDSSLSYHEGY